MREIEIDRERKREVRESCTERRQEEQGPWCMYS